MGEEGDSYPMPLGPSICLALEPWHLLTAIVRLCQMTGQDSHGGTLVNSHAQLCAFADTRAGGTCVCESLQGPEEEAKCWLRPLSLLRWPAVEAAWARGHAESPCVIPTDLPV